MRNEKVIRLCLSSICNSCPEKVVNAYKKIDDGVVGGYQAIEDAVVGTYKKIEDKFVEKFLEEVPEDED